MIGAHTGSAGRPHEPVAHRAAQQIYRKLGQIAAAIVEERPVRIGPRLAGGARVVGMRVLARRELTLSVLEFALKLFVEGAHFWCPFTGMGCSRSAPYG